MEINNVPIGIVSYSSRDKTSIGYPITKGEIEMSNMSYCKFRNTLTDFQDCAQTIGEETKTSKEEVKAAKVLIKEAFFLLVHNNLLDDNGNLDETAVSELLERMTEKEE